MPFVDEAKIFVKAGNGGDGCSSIHRDKFNRRGRPDGGHGGKGGDIIMRVDPNVQTLLDFRYNRHFRAERGAHGGSNNKTGRNGEDLYIRIPPGTTVRDVETGLVLRELTRVGESVIVCRGGAGGKGNSRGREATRGEETAEKEVVLELRLIADAGIVGYPNAGKSTLISKISNARPKVAGYPFTTKDPVLGVVKYYDTNFVVADIPGLIDGAHLGRGLGDRFLRHIERTKLLIHLIDVATLEGRSPYEDYKKLNRELRLYSPALGEKNQIIALNKIDMASEEVIAALKKRFRKKIYPISALTGEGVKELVSEVVKKLEQQ
jgi:GTP-binding protein